MIEEPVDRFFGTPMSEWIERVPNELDVDAVGLWQIAPVGRDSFGLSGEALVDFTRRCILALLERGARPVGAGGDSKYEWVLKPQYGETNEEIVATILREWLAGGARDCDTCDLWFALPSPSVGNAIGG